MEILQDIYLVGSGDFEYSHPRDCNVYLINGGGQMALIDTGLGAEVNTILNNIHHLGFDPNSIEIIINTHCHLDHVGGNKAFKELTGCKIAVHEAEAAAVEKLDSERTLMHLAKDIPSIEPTKVDLMLKDSDVQKIGRYDVKVFHTPGHSPGSICIFLESRGKTILFSGDSVLAQGRLSYTNGPGFDLETYKRSLKKLSKLSVDVLLPGHYTFVMSRGNAHIKLYMDKLNAPWTNITTEIDSVRKWGWWV